MERAIKPISLLDPEIVQAQDTARKLLREFYACTDPLAKDVFGRMFFDEIANERELRRKSQAREAVKNLHDLENPQISSN